ncbi:MAG: methylated-DNA--[protein]-cysteine S-methyltransferase [Halioglobus sp.]|nr:methylated-DNA--[protein]-cysteine S-methyltransferase [Halioglobus sp.]
MNYQYLESPLGTLRIVSNGTALTRIEFDGMHGSSDGMVERTDAALAAATAQLREYFEGNRTRFQLSLAPVGTDFQQQVWRALGTIPYGELRSYREIASSIGRARAVRAVGAANGRNPLPIVVPCHRVVGSDGSLTGFAGGLAAKQLLLELEGAL